MVGTGREHKKSNKLFTTPLPSSWQMRPRTAQVRQQSRETQASWNSGPLGSPGPVLLKKMAGKTEVVRFLSLTFFHLLLKTLSI